MNSLFITGGRINSNQFHCMSSSVVGISSSLVTASELRMAWRHPSSARSMCVDAIMCAPSFSSLAQPGALSRSAHAQSYGENRRSALIRESSWDGAREGSMAQARAVSSEEARQSSLLGKSGLELGLRHQLHLIIAPKEVKHARHLVISETCQLPRLDTCKRVRVRACVRRGG